MTINTINGRYLRFGVTYPFEGRLVGDGDTNADMAPPEHGFSTKTIAPPKWSLHSHPHVNSLTHLLKLEFKV